MSYNFELSNFLDKLREEKKISYEDYLKYRGMADTLEMENERLQKECDSKEEAYNSCYLDYRHWKEEAEEYKKKYDAIRAAYVVFFEKLNSDKETMDKFIKIYLGGKLMMFEEVIDKIKKENEYREYHENAF